MLKFYQRFLTIRQLPVPTIAAINGPAIGAGCCIALATDIRIASKTAKLGLNFVRLGIHPGMGATYLLPNVTNPQVAARLLLTGDIISAEEAQRLGLVVEIVEPDKLMVHALGMAKKIATASPVATRLTLKTLRNAQDRLLEEALWREADAQALCYAEQDLHEGLAAAKEKRDPVFK